MPFRDAAPGTGGLGAHLPLHFGECFNAGFVAIRGRYFTEIGGAPSGEALRQATTGESLPDVARTFNVMLGQTLGIGDRLELYENQAHRQQMKKEATL